MGRAVSLILLCLLPLALSSSLSFDLYPNKVKCFKEEMSKNQVVSGDYKAASIEDPQKKSILVNEDTVSSSYAFTAELDGDYSFCFQDTLRPGTYGGYNANSPTRRVTLTMNLDEEAEVEKAMSELKAKLQPLEAKLRDIDYQAKLAKLEAMHAREREAAHRGTSEEINARVVWMSAFSILIVILLGIWQMYAQRAFLKRKKVI